MPQMIVFFDEKEDKILKKYAEKNGVSKAAAVKQIIKQTKLEEK